LYGWGIPCGKLISKITVMKTIAVFFPEIFIAKPQKMRFAYELRILLKCIRVK